MYLKNFVGAMLVGLIFFTGTASAYDLPKIKVEKQSSKKVQTEKKTFFKSDWKSFELFEQKIKLSVEANKTLPASAKERILTDKNLVFVGIYKGNLYFLDRYSIKIKKNSDTEKSWQQRIFPIGRNISSENTKATLQTFYTDGKNFFNSSKSRNNLAEVEDDADKKFLQECFKVGYFYTFGEETDFD